MSLILDPIAPGVQPYARALFRANTEASSRAIEWWGDGDWSHVDIVLSDGSLLGARSDRIGGKSPGVQIRPRDYEKPARWLFLERPITLEQHDAGFAWLAEQLGKPYDSPGIIDIALRRGRYRDWTDPSSWWCSELFQMYLIQSRLVPLESSHASRLIDPGTAAWTFRGTGALEGIWAP